MHKPLLSVMSPSGARAALSILIFHRVTPAIDPLFPGEPDARRFDDICRWVQAWFNVLPLDEAVARLRARELPARAMAITFDDGYADNHDVAMPILQRHGLPATFFVATGFLDGGCMWNDIVVEAVRQCRHDTLRLPEHLGLGELALPMGDWALRRRAVDQLLPALKHRPPARRLADAEAVMHAAGGSAPRDLMMSSAQVAGLARAGMLLGGHTVNHPILASLSEDEALAEMRGSRERLAAITQRPVDLFAYPNGRSGDDYTARDVALLPRAGYAAAVCTMPGAARAGADLYQLPRFTPWDRSRARFGLRLALNTRTPIRVCGPQAGEANRMATA